MSTSYRREDLGFVPAVTDLFKFMETDYGYSQTHADPTFVIYESADMVVHLHHRLYSYEVEFDINRQNAQPEDRLYLGSILRAMMPGYTGTAKAATTDPDILKKELVWIAEHVRKYAGQLLEAKEDVWNRLIDIQKQAAAAAWKKYEINRTKVAAESAWREKDYSKVVDLYKKIIPHLTNLEEKRLAYAEKRENQQYPRS